MLGAPACRRACTPAFCGHFPFGCKKAWGCLQVKSNLKKRNKKSIEIIDDIDGKID